MIGILAPDLSRKHGWATYSLNLLGALQRAGIPMTVLAAHNSPDVEGIDLHRVLPALYPRDSRFLLRLLAAYPRSRALLRGCDLIHALVEPYAPLAALAAGARPLVITGHGSYVRLPVERRWPVGALYGWAFRRGTLACVSHYTARAAHDALPGVKTVVINNGVEVERFANLPSAQTLLTHVSDVGEGLNPSPTTGNQPADGLVASPLSVYGEGTGGGVRIVLAVGAVKARKGTLELVRAMAAVRDRLPNAQCIIIGSLTAEPAYAARVQAAIHELNLEHTVRLLGHVPERDLLEWYAAADVFCVPSMNDGWKFEGYGLVHLEASAAGLPVIGTRDCGAEDAIDDGVTGLLVSQTHIADELPNAILRILSDPVLAARMGAAGRVKAQGRTWDAVAAQVINLYEMMVGEGLKPSPTGQQ
jgi:glycosyltransferase involved in cell wall biosynthesis